MLNNNFVASKTKKVTFFFEISWKNNFRPNGCKLDLDECKGTLDCHLFYFASLIMGKALRNLNYEKEYRIISWISLATG